MHRSYFVNKIGQLYLVLNGEQKLYIILDSPDTRRFFKSILRNDNVEIKSIRKNGDKICTTYNVGVEVEYDIQVFSNSYPLYGEYISEIKKKINIYLEKERLNPIVRLYGKLVKINRQKSKTMGKMVVGAAFVATVGTAVVKSFLLPDGAEVKTQGKPLANLEPNIESLEEFNQFEYIDKQIDELLEEGRINAEKEAEKEIETLDIDEPLAMPPQQDNAIVSHNFVVDVPFEDRTGSGKLDETISKFGNYIEYYSKRYGISYELACAMISQERPDTDDFNICQLTNLVGETVEVPVYDELGLTGEVDVITITNNSLYDIEANVQAGLGYLRFSIDKNNSFITGLYGYNQGPYTVELACDLFGLNKEDYLGEENTMQACGLIKNYFGTTKDGKWGDPLYLEHVFSYLRTDERGNINLECFVNGEKHTVAINNTLSYNNAQAR